MLSRTTDKEYGHAILEAVRTGLYPDSQELISSDLPYSSLPELRSLLESTRKDVENEIRIASTAVAPDIDGWIAQAERLQHDIQECQAISRSIIAQAEEGEPLRNQVHDAASKTGLLREEVLFNESLVASLEIIRHIQQRVREVRLDLEEGRCSQAVEGYVEAGQQLARFAATSHARVGAILQNQLAEVGQDVKEAARQLWVAHFRINVEDHTFEIRDGNDVVRSARGLRRLGLLESYMTKFCKDFNSAILSPRLRTGDKIATRGIEISNNIIRLGQPSSEGSITTLWTDLLAAIDYLNERLPQDLVGLASKTLMPPALSMLVDYWLKTAIPERMEQMDELQSLLAQVQDFANQVDLRNWPGKSVLLRWVDDIPHIWFSRRTERALLGLRQAMSHGLGELKLVKREETRLVSSKDVPFPAQSKEDWDAGWSDDDDTNQAAASKEASGKTNNAHDDEDLSEWGLEEDDEAEDNIVEKSSAEADNPEETGDAWGWGEDQVEENLVPKSKQLLQPQEHANPVDQANGQRQVTLEETLHITSLPDSIFNILREVFEDINKVSHSAHSAFPVRSAFPSLASIPTHVLAFYRATAPSHYELSPKTKMLLYNDSLWVSEQFQNIACMSEVPRLRTDLDAKALEDFGKVAYSKELEAHRTVLSDLMDGAQGFTDCTEPPHSHECDNAITSTVDRLRYLDSEWRPVLSSSALLQSLGSLLSMVINKMINDVEDMADISEPQCQRLAAFCGRITLLGDLFIPQKGSVGTDETAAPLTAIYTPGWLKFQYLANILESSLADIKFLWIEGELGLEMTDEEVVGLIEALFQDSDHRRRAIADIRRHTA